MSTLALVFLGIIALGSLLQGAFLVWLALTAMSLGRRIGQIQDRLDREVRPLIDNVNQISRNVAEISALTTNQARRMDEFMGATLDKIEETSAQVQSLAVRPLNVITGALAVFRGLRRGVQVYRKLGGLESQGRGRRYEGPAEDEHMFI